MDAIDAMGGSVTAIENGYIQEQIAKSAYQYQQDIESGQKIIVGVNKFQIEETDKIPPFKIDDSIRIDQCLKLDALKKRRDANAVAACLEEIAAAAKSDTNIMPVVLKAVEHYCTLGEIADVLRKVFGEYK